MRKIIQLIAVYAFVANDDTKAQSWSPVGSGIGSAYYRSVRSFATFNDELYAGGDFTTAGNVSANNIAKWDGTNWSPVGNGVNGYVSALCVFNGELYAGGSFSTAGNIAANDIARWNGTSWSNAGSPDCNSINALTVYDGELYAAGFFVFPNLPDGVSIAKWNGATWTSVGPETGFYTAVIECMEVYNGELYVAGAYYLIGGGGLPEYYRISKWNGFNWSDVLTMPASYTLDGALGDFFSMKVYDGELYVAGTFGMMIDTVSTSQIAKWNGTTWSVVGSGINAESYPYGDGDGSAYSFVKTLGVYNGALYAGGRFSYAGSIATTNIARWNGHDWSGVGLGVNGHVYALIGADTCLFVGGWFNAVNGNNIPASKIARWNESCSSAPSQPVIIHGNDTACSNTSQTYYVNETPGATNYTWTLPPGWTGFSTSNTITVVTGQNDGTISVVARNNCGSSIAQTLSVTLSASTVPVIPGNITGSRSPCMGSAQTYSIAAVSNATDYTWSYPSGWTGSSNDTSITLITGQSAGSILVRAYNNCGGSIPKVLPVTVATTPLKPDLIQGNENVCAGSTNLYYTLWPQPATNYSWLLPQGWAGNSSTDSIIVTAGNRNGTISVSAYNSCGSSDHTTLTVWVDSIPSQPADIIGNIYTTINEFNYYSVTPRANVFAYNWSSVGATIQGQNTSSVSVQWKKAGTYELSVQTVNRCGWSERKKITVEVSDFNTDDPFDLQIFPNPSNGEFYLKAKKIENKPIRIETYTITGQLIYVSGQLSGSNDHTQFIDLKKLQQGPYVVRIAINDKIYTRKIVINER